MRTLLPLSFAVVLGCTIVNAQEPQPRAGTKGAQPETAASASRAPARGTSAPRPTATPAEVRAMIERLRLRIAEEGAAIDASPPKAASKAQRTPLIRLVWRASLVWPEELMFPAATVDDVGTSLAADSRSGGM
jgi:hypothetical protein